MAQKVASLAAAGMANVSSEPYVRYDDTGVEPEVRNEAALQNELFDIIRRTQQHNFSMHRHAMRGTHVKTQAIVKGTLTLLPDLPEGLSHGLAGHANVGDHPIAIRFANEPSFLQDDRTPGPRGCGMKIFNVKGEFLDEQGTQSQTQDLTFNNAPILELTDLPTTVDIFKIRERHFRNPEEIMKDPEMTRRKDLSLQQAPAQLPNHHFLGYTMYSQAAYRWGPYVAKYALFPTGSQQKRLADSHSIGDSSSAEQHSEWLRDWFSGSNDATYDLRVQLCQNLKVQPVEDASVQWDETAFPFRTVGKIVLPAGQDVFGAARRAFWDEHNKLNVWYGLEDHRPLGSVQRLRQELYKRSSDFRSKTNSTEVKLLSDINQIP